MADLEGLVCAYRVDAAGKAEQIPAASLDKSMADEEWRWLHFDRNFADARAWLEEKSGLDENVIDALLAVETRPRCSSIGSGTLLILRGVNLNPQSNPEDMIAIRLWIEPKRIISVRRRKLRAVDAIRQAFASDHGPKSVGDFVETLTEGLVERMSPVLIEFEEEIDSLEDVGMANDLTTIRKDLIATRQKLIPLRRYLSPQRDALAQLLSLRVPWMDDWHRGHIRELLDRVTRFVEELDAARERTAIIHDAIANQLAERTNNIMLLLSIVAAIFLPLSFVTGLLGINVGGIPGAETASAFWIVTVALFSVGLFELWLFRRMGWL